MSGLKKWGRGFPQSKIHKSGTTVVLVPPGGSRAGLGACSQGSMSMLSRVSWLRWGELGLGGLLGFELLEGVECLVESESGCMRDNRVGEGLNWQQTKDSGVRVHVRVCVTSRSRS